MLWSRHSRQKMTTMLHTQKIVMMMWMMMLSYHQRNVENTYRTRPHRASQLTSHVPCLTHQWTVLPGNWIIALLSYHPREGCEVLRSACLYVCLSVMSLSVRTLCLRNRSPNFTKFSIHVTCGRGSVLLWRQCNILCTSGFVDDVMFSRNTDTGLESYRLGVCDVANCLPWHTRWCC